MNVLPPSTTLNEAIHSFYVWSDFTEDQTDLFFVKTVPHSGTVAIGDAAKGIVTLVPSDGTVADNDEAYLACPNEVFLFAAGKPAYFTALVQFTEANTDDANIMAGFMNAVGANAIVDDGGGPKASFSGAVIYKVDGGTVWRCCSSNGTTRTDTASVTTAGGSAYQRLEIIVNDTGSSTTCEVAYKVDGVYLKDSNGVPIRHTIPYASLTEMQAFVGVKNGGANLETLNVDYLFAQQHR